MVGRLGSLALLQLQLSLRARCGIFFDLALQPAMGGLAAMQAPGLQGQ